MELLTSLNLQLYGSFFIILLAIILYSSEIISIELTSIATVITLLALFYYAPDITHTPPLTSSDLLSGFSNPALITIMSLLVIGHSIFQTGALQKPTQFLLSSYNKKPYLTIIGVFLFVFIISAFINNTPVVIMFIPIVSAIAGQMNQSTSRVMIPLSYICIFAGMTTLIGSSTNLLVAESLLRFEQVNLSFFSPTIPGLMLSAIGILYLVMTNSFLLPDRKELNKSLKISGKQYIAQLDIGHENPLIGAQPIAGMYSQLENLTIRMIIRGDQTILPPFDTAIQAQDILILAATRNRLTELLSAHPEYFKSLVNEKEAETIIGRQLMLTEAVIAPGSRLIGRSIGGVNFQESYGLLTLGVQRRSRMIRSHLGAIRLEAGDILLLLGPNTKFKALRLERDLILLEWAKTYLPNLSKARMASLIFLVTIALGAFGIVPIVISTLCGASLMIATGCLKLRQAIRAFDSRIYFLVGAAFAMGISLEHSGGAELIAKTVIDFFMPYGTLAVIAALYFLVMLMTNLLSNSATALLFTPIAISTARLINADPGLFALIVLFGANTCFITPIAYQTNLLVMSPGHYKFSDFIKIGMPLALIIWISFIAISYWYYGVR